MEELWTPWRMRYIEESKRSDGCIFCREPDAGVDDFVLARGPRTFTILNLYPYAVGHLMVIPYRHLPRLSELDREERDELAAALARAGRILRRAAGARWFHAGMNLGRAAGAGVAGHLHVHLVPRGTAHDSLGAAEELPVPVEETYRALLPWFESEG